MIKNPSRQELKTTVKAEDKVFSDTYSDNGSSPMWCKGNTCIVRLEDKVFASAMERLPGFEPLNDCRWALMQRTEEGWRKQQADETGRQREPCPIGALPGNRLILSSNPTLLNPRETGGGPARPELLIFDAAAPKTPGQRLLPEWRGEPAFNQHSYRTLTVDGVNGEAMLFQNVGYTHSEWALLEKDGQWRTGQLQWPAYKESDLAPFGAKRVRVCYPTAALHDRTVHYCGTCSYDNWDRVRKVEDLGLGSDLYSPDQPGIKGRQLGNRSRRLLYTWTEKVGENPFHEWLEIDNTFNDGGWLSASDMYLSDDGTVHLLWYRAPMLRSLRDQRYPDIRRIFRIEYATLRKGEILNRQTLLTADGDDRILPTDVSRQEVSTIHKNTAIKGAPHTDPRFHITPDGRLFVVYYVSGRYDDGEPCSENRIVQLFNDGTTSKSATIPLTHPLTQFFTATPRAGCAPSWNLDMLGYRCSDFNSSNSKAKKATVSYAQVMIE